MKQLLNSKKSKTSVNTDSYMSLELGNQMKKISNHTEQHLVDIYQVYLDEKDASDKYRLIFTINPVCSNVLFNAITEVVYKEGSSECKCLSEEPITPDRVNYPNIISDEPITREQAIRDTEYSNDNIYGLTYLPGIDIFNNHLIRQSGFDCVMKRTGNLCSKDGIIYSLNNDYTFTEKKAVTDVFNTIRDFQRTEAGGKVVKKFPGEDSTYLNPISSEPHIYEESEILDFETTVKTQLKEKNGWFGFYNPSTLDIPIGKSLKEGESNVNLYVNKLLNNKNACDFIDMFPDRKRFTFVPQKNPYRDNRLEKNWEYCLTYPYANTDCLITKEGEPAVDESGKTIYNPIVAEEHNGHVINGLMFSVVGDFYTDSGKHRVLIQSTGAIHNLEPNSTISLYYPSNDDGSYNEDGETNVISNVSVKGIGDKNGEMQQYFFSIDAEDVYYWFNDDEELEEDIKGRFCKVIFGIECKYYFRIFRKLPNFKQIAQDEDRAYYIGKYNQPEYDFNSEINKLAFANNIYGDNIVQIVYLDDIDVNGITDSYERPISDIYLTIVKSNTGHELWYPESGTPEYCEDENDPEKKMTIARCFSKVTSGVDLPPEDGFLRDYNVHRIHNIKFDKICGPDSVYGDEYADTRPYENLGNLDKNYNVIEKHSETVNDRCNDVLENLKTLEDDITIDQEFFLGDLVEFSLPQYNEVILEPVYHRFNSAQREWVNKDYKDIITDEIYMDDYEGSETGVTESIGNSFKCVETVYNQGYESFVDLTTNPSVNKKVLVRYPGNLFPEGYYYQPHYRVHLKDISDKISQSSDTQVAVDGDVRVGVSNDEIYFKTVDDYDLTFNDGIVIQDSANNIFYDAMVTNVVDVYNITAVTTNGKILNENVSPSLQPSRWLIFKKTLGIPKYALHYPDTSGKYIWRSLVAPSKVKTDSELYDKPFANGAHYRHLGINFFLKRQDPYGYYELNTKTEISTGETNKLTNFMFTGRYNESIYYNDAIEPGLLDIC